MKIAIGSDHGGFEYKKAIIEYLNTKEIETLDKGTYSQEAADYPDYAVKVGKAVRNKEADFGILICTTGIGMSITANKVRGIRAALITSAFTAESAKSHNRANVMAFGAKTNTIDEVLSYIDIFLKTDNSDAERHKRRVNKINEYEDLLWVKW